MACDSSEAGSGSGTTSASLRVLKETLNDPQLVSQVKAAKVLLVGAGGIGCEVIKTLLLMGFRDVDLIDLDTIDVSNLNRQFLFNKSHVGKSKAEVAAKVSVERFGHKEEISVNAIHNSIMSQDYDLDFFKAHTLVINALDNRAARSHVNRMCLAADVPLIESGSEGYIGQVCLIKKGVSACYECDGPRQDQRTYASCTIRNTPSLPIHCIVWGKHLFAQLFGEGDPDDDVSPDSSDPELNQAKDVASDFLEPEKDADVAEKPKAPSTKEWAQKNDYEPKMLFEKLFRIDIEYLLKMDKLWEKRRKPIPLQLNNLLEETVVCEPGSSSSTNNTNGSIVAPSLKDQRLWSLKECYEVFAESIIALKKRLAIDSFLVWDKDDESALNFVTAVSNLRCYCFTIERKSKFDVKSMAGNIIPAISSTNSIVGGLIGLQVISLLRRLADMTNKENDEEEIDDQEKVDMFKEACRHIFLRKVSLNVRNLVAGYELFNPNPNCLVCATGRTPEIEVACDLNEITMSDFVEQVILNKLHFVCPDVQLDGQATILWSKEDAEEETEAERQVSRKRLLCHYPSVKDKTRLKVYDLLQNQTIIITLRDEKVDRNENEGLFYKLTIISEGDLFKEKKEEEEGQETEPKEKKMESRTNEVEDVDMEERPVSEVVRTRVSIAEMEDDEDVIFVGDDDDEAVIVSDDDSVDIVEVREKRKTEDLQSGSDDEAGAGSGSKRIRI